MSDYRTPQPCRSPQSKPLQFGLRTIFLLTAIVAAVAAGARVGELHGALLAISGLAVGTFTWSVWKGHRAVPQICILAIIGSGLLLLTLPPTYRSYVPTHRNICQNNLKQIALALLNYHDKHGRFPPAVIYDANGKPMHSWRTLILPEIEQGPLFKRYNLNEPWDSPNNKKVTQVHIQDFQCPSEKKIGQFDTSYVALIAPDSIWGNPQGTKLDEITDGDSQTLILIEMKNSGIHWAEPRDLDLNNLPPNIDKKKLLASLTPHKGAIFAACADGHIEALPLDLSFDELKALVSKSGGDTVDLSGKSHRIVPTRSLTTKSGN